jgi:flagellar motor switch protein FliM
MSASIAYAALDCMLGGTGATSLESGADPSPLERSVISRLFQEILSAWTELWDRLKTLSPRVEGVVSSPSAVDLRASDERLFYVVLEVSIARTRGMLRLCIPLSAVKRLLREEKKTITAVDLTQPEGDIPTVGPLSETPVTLSAYIETPPMSLSSLLSLRPGEVLDLRVPANKPFTIAVGEVPKFEGVAGVAEGRVAVRLAHSLDDNPLT